MTTSTTFRIRRWTSAIAIPAIVLLLAALPRAQDPPPAETPPPGQPAAPAASHIEEIQSRLARIEEEIATKDVERFELTSTGNLMADAQRHLSVTLGNSWAAGFQTFDPDSDPRVRELDAEIDKLLLEKQALQLALNGGTTGQIVVAGTPQQPPPQLPDGDYLSPMAPVHFLDIIVDPIGKSESTAHPPDLANAPSFGAMWVNVSSDASSGDITFFTSETVTGQAAFAGSFDFQPSSGGMPWSGSLQMVRNLSGTLEYTGTTGDGFTLVSGEFQVPPSVSSDNVFIGTTELKFITPTGTSSFHGSGRLLSGFDGRGLNTVVGGSRPARAIDMPLLNFAAPWLGGPVLSGNQFSFFDNRGRAIGTGTGTWSVDGDTSLRFQSAEPRLNLRIDYQDDRVTGTFEPQADAPPINIDVDQLLNRTPQWSLGTTWKLRAGVPVEPSQAARKVAENYAGIAWAGDTRLAYSSAGPIYRGPLSDRVNGFLTATTRDAKSQLGAGRLVTPPAQERQPKIYGEELEDHQIRPRISGEELEPEDIESDGSQDRNNLSSSFDTDDSTASRSAPTVARPLDIAAYVSPASLAEHMDADFSIDIAGQNAGDEQAVYFRSLGRSTGADAIEMVLIGNATLPPGLDNLLVLEPVARDQVARIEKQIADTTQGQPTTTARLVMYCLNIDLLTPAPGQIMRLASLETHQQFTHVLSIWDAADAARANGTLQPDSNPDDYYHSIVQWAIWTKEKNFDERGFGDAFVAHTRRNLEQAGQGWSADIEKVVRAVVPNRWRDIQSVLR